MMEEPGSDDGLDYPGRMLHQASIYNNTDFMASLLQGSERDHIDAQDPYGRTALYTSVTNNSLECGHMLLQAGADANIACGAQCGCMTPLHAAALDNKQQFVSILLQYGANMNLKDASGERAIDLAEKNRSEECLAILKSEIEAKDKQRNSLYADFAQACTLGMLDRAKELSSQMSEKELLNLVNNIPDDGNSLLYRSCERGDIEMVDFLLTQGADVQVHPVTGQSPLHGACLRGQTRCVEFMLQYFPELIRAPTIDGTFPLHVACAEGHLEIVDLLLHFPYPDLVKKLFKETKGDRMYRLGLSLNAKDGHGRTPIQLAVAGNNVEIVKHLLEFKVAVALKYHDGIVEEMKPGISSPGVPASQENQEEKKENFTDVEEATEKVFVHQSVPEEFCPVEVDLADLDGNLPLHIAIRGDGKVGFHQIATLLLQHKADPNAVLERPGDRRTPLMEACSVGDVKMMELLLRYGAKDDDQQILTAVVKCQKPALIGAMIQYKSHGDSEFKVNFLAVMERTLGKQDMMSSTSLKALWPNTPVTINWHGLGLRALHIDWFIKSCRLHVGRPPGPAKGDGNIDLSLFAITRIDISNNKLQHIPQELFQLPSLRILNASHNRIKALDSVRGMTSIQANLTLNSVDSVSSAGPASHSDTGVTNASPITAQDLCEDVEWNCPMLEEIYLAKNKMKTIPAQIFSLPSLRKLAVAHNEISSLPYEMWNSPSLAELNLSYNKLQSLPNCFNALEGGLASQLDAFSIRSGSDISCGSKQPTPKDHTLLSSGSHGLDTNTIDVPSVATANTDLTDIVEGSESMSLSMKGYKEIPVQFETHWRERIRVRVTSAQSDQPSRTEKISKIVELNLSHNYFENVPLGLACLAPQLSKLVLSHNLLKQVGPMENYPANLRFLDLSHNKITNDILFECSYGGNDGEGTSTWAIKTCYSPQYQSRHRSHSRDRTTARSGTRPARSGSASSLQTLSSNASSHHVCPHRMHRQLEKLKTLWLTHNKLARLVLTLSREAEEELEDSLEESSKTQANKGRPRLSSAGNADLSEGQKVELFYPNLSVLYICHNNLVTLPDDICELTQLAELKVSYNRLKELPPALGLLKKLWNLYYKGCPVENNLHDLLGDKAKKTSAVLSYLKSIKEEATPYNRMKLMFVGIQGIGKTSLLGQLKKEGRSSPQKNWAQRMGHSTIQDKDLKGENISTVGVDIGNLVIQRTGREVVFSTWDFGGQREYYATHQYFLSKRSLYLVVWKVTDGEKGVNEILQWLVNIQARAPNSPVIIVGTHLDLVTKKKYPAHFVPDLQRMIFDKYQAHTEPDKSGLPRVLGRIEVSCKSRIMYNSHIGDLVNMIWQITSEEQLPGNRGSRLLEQKVPASYVHLQDVVCKLAEERKSNGKDPVLHSEQYKPLVIQEMEEMYNTSFRDMAELNQATQFLHENGVLLHYDDVNLQDIYFLDPQWLCDMLANVVTIREINSLARSGIMRTEDLKVLFKNAAFKPEDIRTYIINLLNKFEVALLWDNKNLLIPSLLPTEMESRRGLPGADVRVPVKGASLMKTSNERIIHTNIVQIDPTAEQQDQSNIRENRHSFHIESTSLESSSEVLLDNPDLGLTTESVPVISRKPNPAVSIVRLYLMAYFPSGFWPRLITRLLADDSFYHMVLALYNLLDVLKTNRIFMKSPGNQPVWKCWQTGVELIYLGVPVLRIKEVSQEVPNDFCDYRQCKLVIKQENDVMWNTLNLTGMSILEIFIPNESLTVSVDGDSDCQNFIMQPVSQIAASFLAKVVEHIDTLLEDWYPDLGARFVQNAKGMYLITRIVPCSRCILQQVKQQRRLLKSNMSEAWSMVDVSPEDHSAQITQPIMINLAPGIPDTSAPQLGGSADVDDPPRIVRTQLEAESAPVGGMLRAAMGATAGVTDSTAKKDRAERDVNPGKADGKQPSSPASGECKKKSEKIYCYLVEQCLQAAQSNRIVFCPGHGNLGPYFLASLDGHVQHAHVAPDSVLQDVGEEYLVYQDLLSRGKFLGKGAFGAVYAGTMIDKKSGEKVNVAMKMLQPVKPEQGATPSQVHMYENEKMRWDKDPMKNACEAYLNARKELTILLSLHHESIVPLVGISLQPLCLILSLAPLGSLSDQLVEYNRAAARLPVYAITRIIMQVASALDYLHCNQIIYRDLKSENILVWSLPPPYHIYPQPVEVKLADYGVSRTVLPSGTKGLAGTPPFIAPEIIQHNGEESYTEKVDCFSFGMFIYEMLLLRLPFDGEATAAAGGANLKGHILAGGRPSITNKELSFPTHILDLMTLCWSHDPNDRPSAAEILAIAQTPEFSHLYNVIHMERGLEVTCACSAHCFIDMAFSLEDVVDNPCNSQSDVWLATRSSTGTDVTEGALLVYSFRQQDCYQARNIPLGSVQICCMCVTEQHVWCADTASVIHVFSLDEYVKVLKFVATSRANVHVNCMAYGSAEKQVYVVMDNGSFVLCDSQLYVESASYSPVKTECPGNGRPIHCIGVLQTTTESSELWCGQAGGRISIWNLHSTRGSLRRVQHFESEKPSVDTVSLALTAEDSSSIWSYVYPGTIVYRWNTKSQKIVGDLDVSKYGVSKGSAPQSPHIIKGRSQVTSMNVLKNELYIGTTAGCLIVADKNHMIPIAICHCHGSSYPYVCAILSLNVDDSYSSGSDEDSVYNGDKAGDSSQPIILTVGKGYRDMIGLVLPSHKRKTNVENQTMMLTWAAEHWTKPL